MSCTKSFLFSLISGFSKTETTQAVDWTPRVARQVATLSMLTSSLKQDVFSSQCHCFILNTSVFYFSYNSGNYLWEQGLCSVNFILFFKCRLEYQFFLTLSLIHHSLILQTPSSTLSHCIIMTHAQWWCCSNSNKNYPIKIHI